MSQTSHAEHSAHLAHHFESLEQQKTSATLGMWAFLVTEVMFFGGLFCGFAVYSYKYPEAFRIASLELDWMLGAINTVFLIGSSLTMALAVRAGHHGKKKAIILNLILTIFFGSLFLGIKAIEYHHKWTHHLVPNSSFHLEGVVSQGPAKIFYGFYFVMTGMHAFHMVIGIGLITWLIILAMRNRFDKEYSTPVEIVGLYWHFVDVVWIYLFPILYLIGRHG